MTLEQKFNLCSAFLEKSKSVIAMNEFKSHPVTVQNACKNPENYPLLAEKIQVYCKVVLKKLKEKLNQMEF